MTRSTSSSTLAFLYRSYGEGGGEERGGAGYGAPSNASRSAHNSGGSKYEHGTQLLTAHLDVELEDLTVEQFHNAADLTLGSLGPRRGRRAVPTVSARLCGHDVTSYRSRLDQNGSGTRCAASGWVKLLSEPGLEWHANNATSPCGM